LKDAQLPFRKQDVFFREGPLGVHLETSNQQMGDFLKQRHFSAVVVSLITDPFITVCKQHDIYYPRDLSVIFAGEEDAMVRLGDTWAGFAEPSSKVVERGLQVLAQTCRGMLSR